MIRREQILEVVKRHFLDIVEDLDPADYDPSRSMVDLGANSLDIVEIVSCSMRELRVRVPRTELTKLENIDELVDLLHAVAEEKASEGT